MIIKDKLEFLLKKFIDEYREFKSVYKSQITFLALYEDVISMFNVETIEDNKLMISLLLNTIYKNDVYVDEFYKVLLNSKNYKLKSALVSKIKNDYLELKNENELLIQRIKRNLELFLSAKRVSTCLKYNSSIFRNSDVFNIKRIISYYQSAGVISNKEELLLINEIELHNKKVYSMKTNRDDEKEYTKNLYNEIPNILSMGFQEHDIVEVSEDRKPQLDKFVSDIINIIKYLSSDEIIEILNEYKLFDIETSEFSYILVSILNNYLEELVVFYEILMDKDVYRKRSDRLEVVKDYYSILDKYLLIRKYYEESFDYVLGGSDGDEPDDTDKELVKDKVLTYSHSSVNVMKSKFVADMDSVPYEYYDTVKYLMDGFVNNNLQPGEVKVLKSHKALKGYIELRYDQVRIILKHIKDNIYNVYGVFAKKDDNDVNMYKTIVSRMKPDISTPELLLAELEIAKHVEEEFNELVQEMARRGSR